MSFILNFTETNKAFQKRFLGVVGISWGYSKFYSRDFFVKSGEIFDSFILEVFFRGFLAEIFSRGFF